MFSLKRGGRTRIKITVIPCDFWKITVVPPEFLGNTGTVSFFFELGQIKCRKIHCLWTRVATYRHIKCAKVWEVNLFALVTKNTMWYQLGSTINYKGMHYSSFDVAHSCDKFQSLKLSSTSQRRIQFFDGMYIAEISLIRRQPRPQGSLSFLWIFIAANTGPGIWIAGPSPWILKWRVSSWCSKLSNRSSMYLFPPHKWVNLELWIVHSLICNGQPGNWTLASHTECESNYYGSIILIFSTGRNCTIIIRIRNLLCISIYPWR